jgi:hypothetical protein
VALPPTTRKTRQRVTATYTVGDPELMPSPSSYSTAPSIGGDASFAPNNLIVIGTDSQPFSIAIPSMTAGQVLTYQTTIGFKNIPTPIQIGPSDVGTLLVTIGSLTSGLTTLVPTGFSTSPQSANRSGGICRTFTLAPGNTYTAFSAVVAVTVWATANTAATTVTGTVQAVLSDQLA